MTRLVVVGNSFRVLQTAMRGSARRADEACDGQGIGLGWSASWGG